MYLLPKLWFLSLTKNKTITSKLSMLASYCTCVPGNFSYWNMFTKNEVFMVAILLFANMKKNNTYNSRRLQTILNNFCIIKMRLYKWNTGFIIFKFIIYFFQGLVNLYYILYTLFTNSNLKMTKHIFFKLVTCLT